MQFPPALKRLLGRRISGIIHKGRKATSTIKAALPKGRSTTPKLTPNIILAAANYNNDFFDSIGVDQSTARSEYRKLTEALGLRNDKKASVHLLAFTALKISGITPGSILELGTLKGNTTTYLSALFPNASIFTVDLPDHDPLYARWYPDGERREQAITNRFAAYPNIHQVRTNTFDLPTLDLPRFDLIWLDAGHFFPEVAWDHSYCFSQLNEGGWLLSDDIRVPGEPDRGAKAGSDAPLRVIEYIRARKSWRNGMLLKCEDPDQFMTTRKYIAWFQKPTHVPANVR